MNLYKLLRSGMVRRWHMNPDMAACGEQNAEHQWEVAMIALAINPSLSRNALVYALTHDVGELDAGDLSYPFKVENPAIAEEHQEFEIRRRAETLGERIYFAGVVTIRERKLIWCADRIAAHYRMIRHAPHLRFDDDWVGPYYEALHWVEDEFGQCDLQPALAAMEQEAERRHAQ